jgi:hypothetical protein
MVHFFCHLWLSSISIQLPIETDLTVNGKNLEVDSFTYLGSEVDNLGGSHKDVKFRIGKVRTAFNMMGSIWKARIISLKTKVRLFNSNVKTIL